MEVKKCSVFAVKETHYNALSGKPYFSDDYNVGESLNFVAYLS